MNRIAFIVKMQTTDFMVQALSVFVHLNFRPLPAHDPKHLRERWQPEWISTILDPEDAKQEAVHHEDDTTPHNDSDLLGSGVCYAWNFQC